MTNALTDLLLAHRSGGTTIDQLSADLVPPDLETAYTIQNETVAALGKVGAWKVQPIPDNGGTPACAPLLASVIHQTGVELKHADLKGLAIEVEVAVTLDRDFPQRDTPYIAKDMQPAIGSVHLAFELLASRYTDRKAVPQLAGIADLQSNAAIVLGAPVPFDTLPDVGQQAIQLLFDGTEAATTPTGPTTENLLSALAWLANHAVGRGSPLTSGTVVITGARLGPVPFAGKRAVAEAPGLGSVTANFF
jgi:2-keto-4-pentenoate hydratase